MVRLFEWLDGGGMSSFDADRTAVDVSWAGADSLPPGFSKVVASEFIVIEQGEFEVGTFDIGTVDSFGQPVMVGKRFDSVDADVEGDCILGENITSGLHARMSVRRGDKSGRCTNQQIPF